VSAAGGDAGEPHESSALTRMLDTRRMPVI
jgi:hypothetical protein